MTPRHDDLVPILPADPAPGHRLPTSGGRLDRERLQEIMEGTEASPATPEERESIRQALSAGVVPRLGLRHFAVGRTREREAMLEDLERIGRGGASLRLLIGDNGAGKTLLLRLMRLEALERNLVVIGADLGPARRLYGVDGEARALLRDLVAGLATRDRPEGGGLAALLERFMAETRSEARHLDVSFAERLDRRLAPLRDLAGGFEFVGVLALYGQAYERADEPAKTAVLRWLRAAYTSRSEARAALGVPALLDDAPLYDTLMLWARFVALAGYGGLLVVLDEMVTLYKITNAAARRSNYELLLRIINDLLEGHAAHLGLMMAGTPEFLTDARRGLCSDAALRSRLAPSRFGRDGLTDCAGPVIRLAPLTREHLFVLLTRIRHLFGASLPDEALLQVMAQESPGDASFRTPRQIVTAFVGLLSVLEQNPGLAWQGLIGMYEGCPRFYWR